MDDIDCMYLTNVNDPGVLKESIFRWRTWYADAINQLAEARLTIKEQRARIKELERAINSIAVSDPAAYRTIRKEMEASENG